MMIYNILSIVLYVLFVVIKADHEFTCNWSDYVTELDGKGESFLSGQYSYKPNKNASRMYRWESCRVNTKPEQEIVLPKTWKDDPILFLGCGGNTGITYININDDKIAVKCAPLNNEYVLNNCEWTDILNKNNDILKYQCRNNGLIRTIYTQYSMHNNDRQFKVECCDINHNKYNYVDMNCYNDKEYRNKYNNPVNYESQHVILNGITSVHDMIKQGRRYKFNVCKPKNDPDWKNMFKCVEKLDKTVWKGTWERTCKNNNNGNSVMIGFSTKYDAPKQDNQFNFKCADLNQNKYGLVNCGYTGYLNNWEGNFQFECPNNGLIRSISSYYMDGFGDRKYRIECCQLTTNVVSEPKGEWVPLQPCFECDKNTYNIKSGVMSTKIKSTSDEYRNELSDLISQGYIYNGILTKNSNDKHDINDEMAAYTLSELNKVLDQSQMKVSSFECDKEFIYQWRQSVTNTLPNVGNHDVFVYSSVETGVLCTDNMIPRCPLGLCNDNDCTSCKHDHTFNAGNNKISNIPETKTEPKTQPETQPETQPKTETNNKPESKPDIATEPKPTPNGLFYDGVNITSLVLYIFGGIMVLALCIFVLTLTVKLCNYNKNNGYDAVKVISNLSDTTDVTTDVI